MNFDQNNNVVKICTQGMSLEGEGKKEEAFQLFQQAWQEASDDFEKFTAAHYVARHQKNVDSKLKWDLLSLNHALKIDSAATKGILPSLYLNVGKCYEELNDFVNAKINYELAQFFSPFLPDDGYGRMIQSGIENGMIRIS